MTFDGGDQSIDGTSTFNNLTKTDGVNDSTDLTLTFEAGTTTTINGTVTWTGLDADDRINLVSSSPGTQWFLNVTTYQMDIDLVDVTDSNAGGGNSIIHSNTIDGGNTVNWFGVVITWISPTDGTFEDTTKWDLAVHRRIPIML